MSAAGAPPPPPRPGGQPQNIAAAIAEISEKATLLIHEEIELAKAEVSEKATRLVKGAVVGVAAGVFFLMAVIFALIGCAWLLYFYLPGSDFTYFWGFFAMAVILVLLGVVAGLIAARVVKRSSPPVPSMAIEEARKIREAVGTSPAPASAPRATVPPQPASAPGADA
ncbi:MAG TPA: phage holin family protein [Solirubrobacteraceae bacterium]